MTAKLESLVTIPSKLTDWAIVIWANEDREFQLLEFVESYDDAQDRETDELYIARNFTERSLDYPTPGNYLAKFENNKLTLIEA